MDIAHAQHPHRTSHEVHIPWFMILGTMLALTAMIIFVCAGPLDTTPVIDDAPPAAAQ
jgi:hypothetical protein